MENVQFKRERALAIIKSYRGAVSGKELKALVCDVCSEPFGGRFLRSDKLVGQTLTLSDLTTVTLSAIAQQLQEGVKKS